jgi:hypothetical protein
LLITYVNYHLTAAQLWQTVADGGCTWFSHAADMCPPLDAADMCLPLDAADMCLPLDAADMCLPLDAAVEEHRLGD